MFTEESSETLDKLNLRTMADFFFSINKPDDLVVLAILRNIKNLCCTNRLIKDAGGIITCNKSY